MKERIEELLSKFDKSAVLRHTESLLGQKSTLSEPFSCGEYWACFEMIAQKSGMLVIARVRLPKHPNGPDTLDEQTELNNLKYEIETMKYIKDRLPQLAIPEVYTYAGPSTKHAEDAGAPYMLIQGFYGDTLHDIEFDMTNLSVRASLLLFARW